jgi:phage gpG-like protein
MPNQPIAVEGLSDLRRSLKATNKDALREVQKVVKRGAEIIAQDSRTLAPRRSGKLAASIRAGTSGSKGIVRSKLPYAKVHEWGGTIRPRGADIKIKKSEFVGRALERKESAVRRELERGFADVARRNGWDT